MSSIIYQNVYLNDFADIAGPYEKKGNLNIKQTVSDFYDKEKSFENCEIKMQKNVLKELLINNKLIDKDIDLLVGGDLMNQLTASSFTMRNFKIPFLGVYSACATFVESLLLVATLINNNKDKKGIALTSSHNLSSEKQFRFPTEYGCLKPQRSTFTATGAVACLVTNQISKVKVESATIGEVVDYGIKDVYNMGAVMAPAAALTIANHLNDLKRDISYYDLILTGDLGEVGSDILKELLFKNNNIKLRKHMDAGMQIYASNQATYAGASGPVALPLVLFNKVLKTKRYKKILVVGTGSLHSPVMCNQKNTIPAIAHALSLEVV